MVSLLQFLDEHFPPPLYNQENGWNNQALEHKLFTQLGCNTSIEDIFYSFKYEVCVIKTWDAVVDECRGTIAKRGLTAWEIVSRPFDKFFNQNEEESGWDEVKFKELIDRLSIVEKADGTCIQMWYCPPDIITESTKRHIEHLNRIETEVLRTWTYPPDNITWPTPHDLISLEVDLAALIEMNESNGTKETTEQKRDHAFQRKAIRKVGRKKDGTYSDE